MAWALVKPWRNNEIFKKAESKYDLLKWMNTKEPVSKKTIKNFKDGDLVTIVYRKEYEKWQQDEFTGRYYKGPFVEVNEVTYTLKEINIEMVSDKKKKQKPIKKDREFVKSFMAQGIKDEPNSEEWIVSFDENSLNLQQDYVQMTKKTIDEFGSIHVQQPIQLPVGVWNQMARFVAEEVQLKNIAIRKSS